jgi:hypothetical protein
VVLAAFGWCFPEDPSNLLQFDKSDVNIRFDSEPDEPATGARELRGMPYRVNKARD